MKKLEKLSFHTLTVPSKIPLRKLQLDSKEAEPVKTEDSQRQLVIAKKCKLCKNKCKIKVDIKCSDATIFCKDFKQASLKMNIPKQEK